MSISPAFLEELRARLPVSDVVGKTVRLQRAGREYKGVCPFHREKSPSFYVNDEKQFFHCFGCGAHGDIVGFTMRQAGLTFPEAVESLAQQAGLAVPQPEPQERGQHDQNKRLLHVAELATQFFEQQLQRPTGRAGLDYLRSRGLTDEAIARFRLGFAPADAQAILIALKQSGCKEQDLLELGLIRKSENGEGYYSFFRNRVIFPIGDRRGATVAFGARLMSGEGPKYINSPDHTLFHKGKLLYGLSRARGAVQQGQPLVVVEGYMDVIAMVEAGYHGAVAPLGTALTEDQMLALWRLLPRLDDRAPQHDYSLTVCFDGDIAGQRAALRALERALPLLTPTQTLRFAFMPSGEDPDSLLRRGGKLVLQQVLDAARPLVDMVWEQAITNRRLQTPEEKAALRNLLRDKTQLIADEALRNLYQIELKERLSALFQNNYSSKQRNQGGRQTFPSVRRSGTEKPEISRPIMRRRPADPALFQERVILATLINHPQLLDEFADSLAEFPFTDAPHRLTVEHMLRLHDQMHDEPLDFEQFSRHLTQSLAGDSAADGLSDILAETTYIHAGFARPTQETEKARQGLQEIWARWHALQTDPDIVAATKRFNAEPSVENQQRWLAVIRAKQALQKESGALVLADERRAGIN